MRTPLSDQRILLFGATGGIGGAVAREAAAAGARLFLVARADGPLAALSAELGQAYASADVTDPAAVDAAVTAAVAHMGGLDAVVLCVGSILLKPLHRTTDEDWRGVLSLNLDAAFYVLRAATRAMMKEGGSVVLVSTAAAQAGVPNHEAIVAAKTGLEGLVRASAATYASRGLRVNAVAPGLVETPLAAPMLRSPASRAASEKMHALGRLGDPDDLAHAIRFLLESSWTTGQVLVVDGGLSGVRG